MKKQFLAITSVLIVSAFLLSACSGLTTALIDTASQLSVVQAAPAATETTTSSDSSASASTSPLNSSDVPAGSDLLAAYESALENVYTTVSPQVVNIAVLMPSTGIDLQNLPDIPGLNEDQVPQIPQLNSALGSGFIWDTQGNIVTNNHVVDGATEIEVTFSDGTIVPATLVGNDPYSDLAVIKVDASTELLNPVTLADSNLVNVGEIAIAIGNPYGLEGTMTVGNVSAIGRDIPATRGLQNNGSSYSIPLVIQTDASVNPGNSGGVLVNYQGEVIGVPSAIESTSGSSAGIGFAIPSEIVARVVPSLIEYGKYEHPYLGISGTSMTPDVAQAMDLPTDTRGALVIQVTPGGPSDKAGLQPSTDAATINELEVNVGGDVITAIDGQTVQNMSDIIAYLAVHTQVGQTVTLTVVRDGQTQEVDVTLGSRPTQ